MKQLLATAMALSVLLAAGQALASDPENGQRLQRKACQRCHDDSIYTRPDSIIFSYKALSNRVHFCERMSGARWNPREIEDVIDYLNQRFYHFEKK